MNATLDMPASTMRPLVHEKVDQLSDVELAAVHRQLILMEMKRGFDELREEMGQDWRDGSITQEKVQQIVSEYRADISAGPHGLS